MDMQSYVDEIKLELTGGLLDLELDDATLVKVVQKAFREIQRYISSTRYETISYSDCIDLNPRKINSVVRIFRANASGVDTATSGSLTDPMLATAWQLMGNGNVYNMNTYLNNYGSWMVTQQIRNTISTDLSFRYDRESNKLYINVSSGKPERITIEYVPRFDSVEEIYSDFWIDMLTRLSIAIAKVIVGRIRSKFKQSNALWALDGDTLIQEGNAELTDLRQKLSDWSQLAYPID